MRQRNFRKSYKNQLMLSEWLVEVPVDIVDKWLLILCPEVDDEIGECRIFMLYEFRVGETLLSLLMDQQKFTAKVESR